MTNFVSAAFDIADVVAKKQVEIANSHARELAVLFQLSNDSTAYSEQQKLVEAIEKIGQMLSSILKAIKAIRGKEV